MESKTFSTNSLTYRFLAWPQSYLPYRNTPDDICDLRRAVIAKAFLLAVSIAFGIFAAFSVASYGLYVLSKFFPLFSAYGAETFAVHLGRVITLGVTTIGILAGLVYLIVIGLNRLQTYLVNRQCARDAAGLKPMLHPVTSPVREMYRSLKDKLCYRVEFK